MENNKQVTYDDMVQTRNIKMLKSIVPFLDFRSQKPAALLIQYLEFKNADSDIMSKCSVLSSGASLSEASKHSMSPYFMIHVAETNEYNRELVK